MPQDFMMRTAHQWPTAQYENLNRPDTTWLYNTTSSFASTLAAAADTSKYPYAAPGPATFLTETPYDNYTNVPLPQGMSIPFKGDWDTYFSGSSTTTFPYRVKPAAVTIKENKQMKRQCHCLHYHIAGEPGL